MKYKIIVDSSSDLIKDDFKNENIDFEVIPLTIHIKNEEFKDTENLDIVDMLNKMNASSEKATSSCPSPGNYLEAMTADYNFVVTITSKLSGSYNSATLASNMLEDKKCFIIDSKGTAGLLEIIMNKLVSLINQGLEYDEICQKISEFRDTTNLFFMLDKFDNLVKNGRMSKITAFVAKLVHITPICQAVDGEIKIYQKVRTKSMAFKKMIEAICLSDIDFSNRVCIISHAFDLQTATYLKDELSKVASFKEIIIRPMRGLCSFYALEGGIIISY